MKSIFENLTKLNRVGRYSQEHLNRAENVLEHSGFTALFCLLCNRKYNFGFGEGVLLRRALLHDFDEIVTGDIPRPTKYFSDEIKEALDEVSEDFIVDNLDPLRLGQDFFLAKDGEIGQLVKLADFAAVAWKISEEIETGNRTVIHVMEEMYANLASTTFDQLFFELKDDLLDIIVRCLRSVK